MVRTYSVSHTLFYQAREQLPAWPEIWGHLYYSLAVLHYHQGTVVSQDPHPSLDGQGRETLVSPPNGVIG